MSSNIEQRSIDQAKQELKRAQAAVDDAVKHLRRPANIEDALLDLDTAKKRCGLALRQLS